MADLESALEAAFDAPAAVATKAPLEVQAEPQATEAPEVEEVASEEPVEAAETDVEEAPAPVITEPEYEVEVDGRIEMVRGGDKVKELLQKGLKFGRGSEEVARVREALAAQMQSMQQANQFQQAVVDDISHLEPWIRGSKNTQGLIGARRLTPTRSMQ
jgi:hypothetical protein